MNTSNVGVAPKMLNVEQIQVALSLGRSKVYELISSGELASVRVGRRRLVPAQALERWIASLSDRTAV